MSKQKTDEQTKNKRSKQKKRTRTSSSAEGVIVDEYFVKPLRSVKTMVTLRKWSAMILRPACICSTTCSGRMRQRRRCECSAMASICFFSAERFLFRT